LEVFVAVLPNLTQNAFVLVFKVC